jgi:folate-binding protein YgfZ
MSTPSGTYSKSIGEERSKDSGAPESQGVCVVPGCGILKVLGDDAAAFLQGQVTCDVNGLAPGGCTMGALCTPKGRVVASFRLLRAEQHFYLLLAADLAEALHKRLQIFVLRSKVSLDDLTSRRTVIGLLGNAADSVLSESGIKAPAEPGIWLEQPDYFTYRLNDGSGRCLIAMEPNAARELQRALAEKLDRIDPEVWRLRDIETGFPEVTAATSEEFLPQMLNLDILGGIGFKKGCYTGQEIIARTHYLGQVKRRMFRLRAFTESTPSAGTPIFDTAETEPKSIGQIVSAAPESPASCQLLAVMGLDHAHSGNLRLQRPDGTKAELLPLPYSLSLS